MSKQYEMVDFAEPLQHLLAITLLYSSATSWQSRRAVRDWLKEVADGPDEPGRSTEERISLAIAKAMCRPSVAENYRIFLDNKRKQRLSDEREAARKQRDAEIMAEILSTERSQADERKAKRLERKLKAERLLHEQRLAQERYDQAVAAEIRQGGFTWA